jgi:ornithine--oxo-acid transaminase
MLMMEETRMSTQSIGEPQILPAGVLARPTYLMCFPKFYDVAYVINPWMTGNLHAASGDRSIEQWRRLYKTLCNIADVVLVDPEPGLPDMVFTANAGLEHNGVVMPSRFVHPERRPEEASFRSWFLKEGYEIVDLPQKIYFEGEGDALFSSNAEVLWAGYGMRTDRESHPWIARTFGIKVISLHLIDPRFYHLDTCFAPLEDGYIFYYPPAFDKPSVAQIEQFYPPDKRIMVNEDDACRFACNAISIGSTIVLNEVSRELKTQLEAAGFNVLMLPLDEFLKAGGAAKCLVMKLSHPATPQRPSW